ncbi:MAG: hypothetical protein K8W52_29515 [Deltaproteobacteria bacterium]|nr:hypothetical protein [Deltaproteobacteria bacterium]
MSGKRVLGVAAVIAVVVGAWLAVRGCGAREAGVASGASVASGAAGALDEPRTGSAAPPPAMSARFDARAGDDVVTARDRGAGDAGPAVDGGGALPSDDAGVAPRDGAVPTGGPLGVDDRGEPYDGGLVDRRGRNDGLGAQLNREFMPLASECIDLAQARNPALTGTLILQISLAPGDHGKAIVAAVKPRADNTIADPELLECIRESSFSLDALVSPYDFDLTMPITPVAVDASTR